VSERSPYAAPSAKVSDPAPRPGSPYKAVIFGLLTDFGGTIALSVLLTFIWGVAQSPEVATGEAMTVDPWYSWVGFAGGFGFSVLGGYVCARVAGQSEYTLGAILAVLVVVLGLLLFGSGEHDFGVAVALNAATVVAVIVGAWIGKKRNRRQRPAQ
jgi:hypothetical protein